MIRRMTRPARRTAVVVALLLAAPVLAAGAADGTAAPSRAPVRLAGDARGTWQVQPLGSGRYAVAWTSPVPLPMTDDRPRVVGPRSVLVGVSTVAGDTVRATITSPVAPDSFMARRVISRSLGRTTNHLTVHFASFANRASLTNSR